MAKPNKEQREIERAAVENYLTVLRNPEIVALQSRIDEIDEKLGTARPMSIFMLYQERMVARDKLAALVERVTRDYEREFIIHARGYAKRHHITYAAFRTFGVPGWVLATAGIDYRTPNARISAARKRR